MKELYSENIKKEIKELSFRELALKYFKYLPLYLFVIACAIGGAWVYLRYAQESFSSQASLLLDLSQKTNSKEDKVEDLLSNNSKSRNLTGEIEILTSKPLAERVVKSLGLQYTYTALGKIKSENVYKKGSFSINTLVLNDSSSFFTIPIHFIDQNTFSVNDEGSYKFGEVFKTENGQFQLSKIANPTPNLKCIVSYTPISASASALLGGLTVLPKGDSRSTIVEISYKTNNAILASDIVASLIDEYNKMSLESSNQSMDQTLKFAENNMQRLNFEVDSIQKLLVEFQQKNQVVDAKVAVDDLVQEARAQRELIMGREMGIMTLGQIENNLNNQSFKGRLSVPSSMGIEDLTLNQLITNYNELQIERSSLIQSNVPESNPRIAQIDENINGLRLRILENTKLLKSNYQKSLGMVHSQTSRDKSMALGTAPKVKEQMEYERQLQQKLDILSLFEKRRIEILMSKVGIISNFKVINYPEVNKSPISPKRSLIYLIALGFGLFLPTVIAVFKELLNDKINTRSDIEKNTDTPILGEIGHSHETDTLIVDKTKRTAIVEQFRILRSNLHFILGNKPSATILVTSSFGGEGKSFISTNMSAVMALTDKKTIVLEFDLRKPRVLAGLDFEKKPGVSNYMVGDMQLDELILPIPSVANLYVLPCGPIPPNPAELLLSDKVALLFAELKKRFEYIIIDTAPVGMVSDGLTLGKFADATIYVSRQGYTFKKQVNLIDELYTQKKLPNMSIVINDVKAPTGGGYYGNYGYGYGYGYGEKDGYFVEEKHHKKSLRKSLFSSLNPFNWFK
ncbi:MAG: polysaccharide biosynthesis tyrosine autokinase [Bacteroidia bacterium]|nr:MAG: polysaccharide biosynthesis tyrosine autokinase [Bacteroidia bacterium]